MRKALFLTLTFPLLLLTNCNNNEPKKVKEKTPEELKAELKQLELSEPKKYLALENVTIRDSMLLVLKPSMFNHSKYAKVGNIAEGTIKCSSSLAKYKDIIITVSFYSQTETLIGSKDFTLYKYYSPNSKEKFELHVIPPADWKEFSATLKSATGVE